MLILILIFISLLVHVDAYTNNVFKLLDYDSNVSGGCGGFTDNPKPVLKVKHKLLLTPKRSTIIQDFTFNTVGKPRDLEPDTEDKTRPPDVSKDLLGIYPSGQLMRAELFNNKSQVHLPRPEWIHPGHNYLNISTPDFMQTAVNAFCILLDGSLNDVLRLPSLYVLRSDAASTAAKKKTPTVPASATSVSAMSSTPEPAAAAEMVADRVDLWEQSGISPPRPIISELVRKHTVLPPVCVPSVLPWWFWNYNAKTEFKPSSGDDAS